MCTLSYKSNNPSLGSHRLVLPSSTAYRCVLATQRPDLDPAPHLHVSPPERWCSLGNCKTLLQKHRRVCPWVCRAWAFREGGPGTVSHHCCHPTLAQYTSWFSPPAASAVLNLTFLIGVQPPPRALSQPSSLSAAGSPSASLSLCPLPACSLYLKSINQSLKYMLETCRWQRCAIAVILAELVLTIQEWRGGAFLVT